MSHQIYQKIKDVMADVPKISKTHKHAQGWQYRGLEDFLSAFHPVLQRHGLFLLPEVVALETGTRITDGKNDKPGAQMHFVIATVAYSLFAEDGSSVRAVVIGESWDNSDNASTKAMNDALTTFFTQVFCVPTGDAVAGQQNQPQASNARQQAQSRPPQQAATGTTSNILPIEPKRLTADEMQRRAEQLVREARIACEGNKCTVRANSTTTYEVSRAEDKKLACQCERFKLQQDCEHVRAVRLHFAAPKSDGRAELSMLIADLKTAGMKPEEIDATLAKLCEGVCEVSQLDAAQIARAKHAFQMKLAEMSAVRQAA